MESNLKQWAESLSGCDGGNVKAETWLCGIEWGQGSYDEGIYYEKHLPDEIEKGAITLEHSKFERSQFDWKESVTYPFGRSFAKLWTVINNEDGNVENYRDVASLDGSQLFKLNLYPIAFDSTDHKLWRKYDLDETTGFESKYLFNTWCFFNRFPAYAKLRAEHKPKLIICTGVDYLRDFLMCFAGNEGIDQLNVGTVEGQSEKNKYIRNYYWVKLDGTLIVVIPFFSGRYGLNSNYLLEKMGCEIKKLMIKDTII